MQHCHESVDCTTGNSLGIPSYLENQCSFQSTSTDDDDILAEEDSVDDNVSEGTAVPDPEVNDDDDGDDGFSTYSPTTKKPNKKMTDTPTNAPIAPYAPPSISPISTLTHSPSTSNNSVSSPTVPDYPLTTASTNLSSREPRFSPIVATFIVIGLIIIVSIQLILYKQLGVSVVRQQQQQQRVKNTEEILYIEEPLEFDGIDKILSKDNNSDENDSQLTMTDNGNDASVIGTDPNSTNIQRSSGDPSGRWGNFFSAMALHRPSATILSMPQPPKAEIRHFHTASIVERTDQNEVEALYMMGQHHVHQQPPLITKKM
jgi:hypothetical protein